MSELQDAANFALDPRLSGPLRVAIETAAIAIMNEDPATPNHTLRTRLAIAVVQNPNAFTEPFAWAVATNPAIVTTWTAGDFEGAYGDLQFVTNSVWDSLAGVCT